MIVPAWPTVAGGMSCPGVACARLGEQPGDMIFCLLLSRPKT